MIQTLCLNAKKASVKLGMLNALEKNHILHAMAQAILNNASTLLSENLLDIQNAKIKGLSAAFIDRLTLTDARITAISEAVLTIASLKDPVGEVVNGFVHENGMQIEQVRVPIGVIAMIYESRPNVTVDAAALAIKSGNAIILRGGSDAFHTNMAFFHIINQAALQANLPLGAIQILNQTDRSLMDTLLKQHKFIDVVIPRGGVSLKNYIIKNSTIPVIETGAGICHTYIDSDAEESMAVDISINAKTHRPGVCNAMETLLIHQDIISSVAPKLEKAFLEKNVTLMADSKALKFFPSATLATNSDWETEYLDLTLSIKCVSTIQEAILHINHYGTKHSEAIVTNNYTHSEMFLNEIDASTVYVNASTRFTDGGIFGFGGEIGISTQKLHARGPMGIRELTTLKYKVRGQGQIRQ